MNNTLYLTHVFELSSFIGSVAFALSGYLIGVRKNLDVMGIFILAFLTANGGGVVRDILTDRTPTILLSTMPFWLTAVVMAFAAIFRLQRYDNLEQRWLFVVSDAIGLVAFGITGAMIGIENDLHFFGVLVLSFLTAAGGGILRDLLVNNVPEVLHAGFYGSVAILLGAAIYVLQYYALVNPITLGTAFICALGLRLLAYKREWKLPKLTE